MFNEVDKLRARYAQIMEDGRRVEVFSTMPEYQWWVEHVIKPTIDEYTHRVMSGGIQSEKEDWVIRGMVMGMQLILDTTETFIANGKEAKKKAKALKEPEE
jgi:hypothetical protein